MKPKNIKISAFGPYKNEIEIDFTKLGDNGIFLITGDTGSGKTTIFDAISFALFGEVSGSNRPVASLRSDFSEQDIETFVELEFTHKNQKYKIRRNPTYQRLKKKGDGFTTTSADASLQYGENIITGSKNVDNKIEEILGINAKQFKQISMLAQGEFFKILFAESKERTEIFRKIFDTDIYNIITKKLGEKTKIVKEELQQLKDFFVVNTANIIFQEKNLQINSKELNELIAKNILEELEKEIKLNTEICDNIEKNIEEQEKKTNKLEEELKAQIQKNEKIDIYNLLKQKREELNQKQEKIEETKIQIQKSQEIANVVKPKEEKLLESQNEIEKAKQELKKLEKQIANKEIEGQPQKLKSVSEYEQKLKEYEKINIEYIEKEDEFFREQAGILAEKLEKNKPCPVCGSLEHPHIAQKSENVLTKEELDKLKNKLEENHKKLLQIRDNIAKEREELIKNITLKEEKEKQLDEKEKKQKAIKEEYEKTYKKLGFDTEEQYKKSILNKNQIEKLTKEIEQYNKDITINDTKIKEIEQEVKNLKKEDLTEKTFELRNQKNQLDELRKIQTKQKGIYDNNNRILQLLSKNEKELSKKIEEFNIVEELYKTSSGTLYGKKRIEFEQYVQTTYFDMIIVEANKRLLNMTENRFQLIRKESSEKVSDRLGLELEVIDNYNGKKRDVKSLSGGEAFKAALSLALGLSDIIQSYSGGIIIDTMFIDEGFGSLDTESREQAINTLSQLIGNNKLIGIISHVTELKERIDKKIIITKTNNGSRVQIEV